MTQEDARNFIMALNSIGGYVPPIQFQVLTNNPVIKAIEAMANGHIHLEAKPKEIPKEQLNG